MKRFPGALAWLLMTASAASAQGSRSWGNAGMMRWFTYNAAEMMIDPVYLGGVIICLAIASRFLVWGLMVVGALAGPVALFISINTLGDAGYQMRGSTVWTAAIFVGMGFGFGAIFLLRMMGRKE
jgi:hypothetical protein